MRLWQVREARAKFREFLEASITKGLKGAARPELKDLLLAREPRFDHLDVSRGKLRRRRPRSLQ